jgi:hypothetical protein
MEHGTSFDPHTVIRMFRLCMPDVGQRIPMPKLLDHLRTAAPSVRIDLSYPSEVTGLRRGRITLE